MVLAAAPLERLVGNVYPLMRRSRVRTGRNAELRSLLFPFQGRLKEKGLFSSTEETNHTHWHLFK